MPKVQIELPQDVYNELKKDAKPLFQSLRSHIAYRLINLVRNKDNIVDLSALPNDTTVKLQKQEKKKPTIPKRDLIKEAWDKEGIFRGRVHSDDTPFTNEEYQDEILQSYRYRVGHAPRYIIT